MPRIIELLLNEPDFPASRVIFMMAMSGLSGGAILIAINSATEQISLHQADPQYFVAALVLLVLMVYTQHYTMVQMTLSVEETLLKLRMHIGNRLRHADLRFIEQIGGAAVYSSLTKDTHIVSQSALSMTLLGRSSLVLLVSLIYLGWISPSAMLATIGFIGTYAVIHAYVFHPRLLIRFDQGKSGEEVFFRHLQALLGGLKEIKLNRGKNNNLFESYSRAAGDISTLKRDINAEVTRSYTLGYSAFYLLLIVLAIVIPGVSSELTVHVFKITAIVIYIISELDPWLTWIPEIARADAAVEELHQLELKLRLSPHAETHTRLAEPLRNFSTLSLCGVEFCYQDHHGGRSFPVGPLNLTVRKGELLFIVGGNGSGKTTLLKLLAGLYYPDAGTLLVDDRPLQTTDYSGFRELFSAVFPDFYLFERLYGLQDVAPEQVHHWLRVMQISDKTSFANGAFTRRELSTGQRKRLAFIAAVLENRPLLIVDEFAADQDPEFRDHFYMQILPELKRQGRTVLAVTHDDRYFNVADRVLVMADGRLR